MHRRALRIVVSTAPLLLVFGPLAHAGELSGVWIMIDAEETHRVEFVDDSTLNYNGERLDYVVESDALVIGDAVYPFERAGDTLLVAVDEEQWTLHAAGKRAAGATGSDRGTIELEDMKIHRRVEHRSGNTTEDFHVDGAITGTNPASPFFGASVYIAGSTTRDADGGVLHDAAVIAAWHENDQFAWGFYIKESPNGPAKLSLYDGTGTWREIEGSGELQGLYGDGPIGYAFDWNYRKRQSSPEHYETFLPLNLQHEDVLETLHGPHLDQFERKLGYGENAVWQGYHQLGAIFGSNPDSPFYRSTYDTNGIHLEGRDGVLDASVTACMGPDGHSVFVIWTAWYDEMEKSDGTNTMRIAGGSGPWQGITGYARSMSARDRKDDRYNVIAKAEWNLPEN